MVSRGLIGVLNKTWWAWVARYGNILAGGRVRRDIGALHSAGLTLISSRSGTRRPLLRPINNVDAASLHEPRHVSSFRPVDAVPYVES